MLIDTKRIEVSYLGEGYIRAGGSFWGLLVVSAYLLLLFFPLYVKRIFTRNKLQEYTYLSLCGLIIITVLINAHRSVWLGFLLGWTFFSFARGLKGLFVGTCLFFILLYFLPSLVFSRFFSIFKVSDITWAHRVERYAFSKELIFQHPLLGVGWGGSGWVHNFILQIGANLGLMGLFAFFRWLTDIFWKSFKMYKKIDQPRYLKAYNLAFLTSAVSFLMPMAGESVYTWPSFMIPYWFFLAVLHNFNNGNIFQN